MAVRQSLREKEARECLQVPNGIALPQLYGDDLSAEPDDPHGFHPLLQRLGVALV